MKKIVRKTFLTLAVLLFTSNAIFAQDSIISKLTSMSSSSSSSSSTSTTSYTSTTDIKKAQVAMASNEYIVTAGDIYTLAYADGSFSISVDSTYKVRVASLGIIDARGLTFQEFKNKVEGLIVNNYPTSGIQFFLANPAAFQIFVKGEVVNSAIIETWALEHVSALLENYYTDYSSQRLITIVSANGKEKQYDLFKARRDGDFSQDPYLRPGDTVIVHKVDRKVVIDGGVKRPGVYELLPGEELKSLIFDYAEGFTPFADRDAISLSRFVGGKDYYNVSYLKETDLHIDIPLACYDKVFIGSMDEKRSVVYVEGAVSSAYDYRTKSLLGATGTNTANNPGVIVSSPVEIAHLEFPFDKGQTCFGLVIENSKMIGNSADLTNAVVKRKDANGVMVEKPINLNALIHPEENVIAEDIVLQAGDIIVIPYIQYFVTVTGGVVSRGRYPYQPGKNWQYYVNLANGFDLDQNLFKSVKIYDKDGKKLSKKDVIPPEASITALRNSPRSGWLIPLITSIFTFLGGFFTFYASAKGFRF